LTKIEEIKVNLTVELIEAVKADDILAVKDLLEKGADPNSVEDEANITPLHFAVAYNAINTISLLVASGGNIYAKTCDGLTPLDLAKNLGQQEAEAHIKMCCNGIC